MPAPASTLTALTLIADVRRQFGDADAIQISDADILSWINQGALDIVSNNPILEAVATTTTVPNSNVYALPADLYQLKGVQYDKVMLGTLDFDEATTRYGADLSTHGIPSVSWVYGNNVYLYPAPDKALTLTIYYVQSPVKVSVSSSLLPVPDRYYNTLLQYVLARAFEMDEQADLQNTQEQLYASSTTKLKNVENIRGATPVMTDRAYEGYDAGDGDYYGW